MAEEKTTIQISLDTKSRLDKLGFKNDSYDDVIKRLLDKLNGNAKDEQD